MAATFKLDTKEGAQLDVDTDPNFTNAKIRTGIVSDIDTTTSPDPLVLEKALAAVEAVTPRNSQLFSTGLYLTHIRIIPLHYNRCKVFLAYEENKFLTETAYILRDRAYLGQRETTYVPGTRVLIKVAYVNTSDHSQDIPSDVVRFSLMMPMRAINVTAVVFGSVPAGLQDNVGKVNNATWRGKPIGYWVMNDLETGTVKYEGFFSYSATAITKVNEDWSEFGILQRKETGKYAPVTPAEVTALTTAAYTYGVTAGNGIVRLGPFPLSDYTAILGFT